jgi:pyrroloquinoline quinone (PQQ) biosynthesis protein C
MKPLALTPKQREFCNQYVVCRNGGEAARRAGYSEHTRYEMAYENLRKPQIVAYLAENEAELQRLANIDKNRVISEVMEGINLAKMTANAGSVITGWVRIGEMLGVNKPEVRNVELSTESAAQRAKFDAMTDDELVAIIKGDTFPTLTTKL